MKSVKSLACDAGANRGDGFKVAENLGLNFRNEGLEVEFWLFFCGCNLVSSTVIEYELERRKKEYLTLA